MRFADVVRDEAQAVDADQSLEEMKTLEQQMSEGIWPLRLNAIILSALAAFAMVLAAIGIYGLVAYTVAQRTREIGIRVALGAQRQDVLRLVGRQAIRLTAIGVVAGLAGTLALNRVIKSMLFGASATDPLVFAIVTFALATVAMLASWVPARRATRVDPIVALRAE
jgi:ABC-type antimicrobial peptide transport system permease subunit